MNSYGHDPRRTPSERERKLLYERAQGRCQRCGTELGADYHAAHLIAWRNGGATDLRNMQAWCARCNLGFGAQNAKPFPELTLRDWQANALPTIADRIFHHGNATLHAAPGAGKTIFAAALFKILRDAGYIQRMTVIVPTKALVQQWRSQLAQIGIHLDPHPANGAIEANGLAGVIVTYQSLPSSADVHAVRQGLKPTLVVLDEVHHVAADASWGLAVQRMIGEVVSGQMHTRAVLNMTGTLFRSNPKLRISTVRYTRLTVGGVPKVQAVADWSVPTHELINTELRAPDLYIYGGHAECVDITKDHLPRRQRIADLDEQIRAGVMLKVFEQSAWIEGFAREAVSLLSEQLLAIGNTEPLKLLFVAPTLDAARQAAQALNRVTGTQFARVVTSEEPGALSTLRLAAEEPRSCGLVTVRMITEGFDCPQVATIAYATNITAPLFVSQMMARAMRRTRAERETGSVLPAKILIPDHPGLRVAFTAAINDTIPLTDDETYAETKPMNHDGQRLQRYELLGLDDPSLSSVNVLDQDDGEIRPAELASARSLCETIRVPTVYAPRVAVGLRHRLPPAE